MRHGLRSIRHDALEPGVGERNTKSVPSDFVLEKSIFNNIFEKDIKRVFMYKKAERLAKAIHLIAPAFTESPSLRDRVDTIAVGLVDAAILPPSAARNALARELLTLSSVLAIARTSGLLSAMNADLITREVHFLLQEVAAYEQPRLLLEDTPTLSEIAKSSTRNGANKEIALTKHSQPARPTAEEASKGHLKDNVAAPGGHVKDRRESILAVIKDKQSASIKDISHMIRGVSEKTVQRELAALIEQGILTKKGERRWSTYSFA